MTAAAENGRANDAVVRLLAETLELPRGNVSVVSGRAARTKVVELAGMAAEETERRLAAAGEDGAR